jgi:hypothetical protein
MRATGVVIAFLVAQAGVASALTTLQWTGEVEEVYEYGGLSNHPNPFPEDIDRLEGRLARINFVFDETLVGTDTNPHAQSSKVVSIGIDFFKYANTPYEMQVEPSIVLNNASNNFNVFTVKGWGAHDDAAKASGNNGSDDYTLDCAQYDASHGAIEEVYEMANGMIFDCEYYGPGSSVNVQHWGVNMELNQPNDSLIDQYTPEANEEKNQFGVGLDDYTYSVNANGYGWDYHGGHMNLARYEETHHPASGGSSYVQEIRIKVTGGSIGSILVPEPTTIGLTIGLFALTLLGTAGRRRRS